MTILLIIITILYLAKGLLVAQKETAKHGSHPMWILVVAFWPLIIINQK